MQQVGEKAKVFKNISDGEIMVRLDNNPELAHAFEALLARGLARELPEGGIRLRSDVTQADINAAIARKSWAISLEVRKLRSEVSRIDEGVKALNQKWSTQAKLNWIFGLTIFAIIAFLLSPKRETLKKLLPKKQEKKEIEKKPEKKEVATKPELPRPKLQLRQVKLKPQKIEKKEEKVAI